MLESLEPGLVAYTKPGEKVSFLTPTAAGGYRDYKITELQAISSGTGVPYEAIASDMSATTYSSWRGGQLGFRNSIEAYRWLSLMPMFCNPVWKRFVDTLVLLGKIPAKLQTDQSLNLYGVQWTAPKFESVDPLKDAKAELQRIRTGTETLFGAIAANGGDPRTQLQQIATINKLLDSLGVVLDSDPRYTNIRGQEQPGDEKPNQPGRQGPANAAKASASGDEDGDDDDDMLLTVPRGARRWDSCVRRYGN
jgi:capsid protein